MINFKKILLTILAMAGIAQSKEIFGLNPRTVRSIEEQLRVFVGKMADEISQVGGIQIDAATLETALHRKGLMTLKEAAEVIVKNVDTLSKGVQDRPVLARIQHETGLLKNYESVLSRAGDEIRQGLIDTRHRNKTMYKTAGALLGTYLAWQLAKAAWNSEKGKDVRAKIADSRLVQSAKKFVEDHKALVKGMAVAGVASVAVGGAVQQLGGAEKAYLYLTGFLIGLTS